jgi:SPP1 family predicted phage head-tail adaptor
MLGAFLNRIITIEQETTSVNAVGTPVETYAVLKKTFATVKYTSGGTQFNEGAMPYTDTEFSIRFDERINYKCRVLYNTEYYKILHLELIGRKDGMRLKCIKWDT